MTDSHAAPTPDQPKQGLRSITAREFSALDSVGGLRGLIEATAPGLIYLVVFISTMQLAPALISSLVVAALLVIIRLLQRTPVTMAFSGIFGVGIGLFIAWKSGDASDFYVWGLLVNLAYILGLGLSLALRWPGVGLMVEFLKSGLGTSASKEDAQAPLTSADGTEASQNLVDPAEPAAQEQTPAVVWPTAWRKDPILMKKYTVVTWLWVAMFALRLGVQGPLYLAGASFIAALGTARLVMGLPLFALVLWLTWRIVRQPESPADQPA